MNRPKSPHDPRACKPGEPKLPSVVHPVPRPLIRPSSQPGALQSLDIPSSALSALLSYMPASLANPICPAHCPVSR